MVSVTITCQCSVKMDVDNVEINENGYVAIEPYLQNEAVSGLAHGPSFANSFTSWMAMFLC